MQSALPSRAPSLERRRGSSYQFHILRPALFFSGNSALIQAGPSTRKPMSSTFPRYVPGHTCITLGRNHNYVKAGQNSVRCTECGSSRTVAGAASNLPSCPPVISTETRKPKMDSKLDTQLVELVGRNWLTVQPLQAGLEVARPERDRGIDLIAYRDLDEKQQFLAYPIQMKAFLNEVFGIDPKYEKFPRLILAYVWNLANLTQTRCFALTFKEALQIAEGMGYTKTA